MVVFRCGGGVLLVFDPRKSGAPGREVPSHGTSGAGTLPSRRSRRSPTWRQQLRRLESPSNVRLDEAGRSLYFRDPAGNVVELALQPVGVAAGNSAAMTLDEPIPKKPLRCGPALFAACCCAWCGCSSPSVFPDASVFAVLGGLVGSLIVLVWWCSSVGRLGRTSGRHRPYDRRAIRDLARRS